MTSQRDFASELQAAREAQDWATHAQIWEDRRVAAVQDDEDQCQDDDQPGLYEFEKSCENGWLRQAEYCQDALDEMERQDWY
jgi:hypothetical protein